MMRSPGLSGPVIFHMVPGNLVSMGVRSEIKGNEGLISILTDNSRTIGPMLMKFGENVEHIKGIHGIVLGYQLPIDSRGFRGIASGIACLLCFM
jgi:hypothetical protein